MDEIIELLDSARPEDRKRGIKLLVKSEHPEAMRYLSAIYKNDPDAEVRDLAVKGGRYLRKKADEAKWTGGGLPANRDEDKDDDEDHDDEKPKRDDGPVEVSKVAEQRAQGYVDQAMNLHIQGKDDKALEALRKAFESNPNLRNDSYTTSLAGSLMGDMNANDAVDEIMAMDPRKEKRKRKNDDGTEAEELTWQTAAIDLAIYWVVTAGITIVTLLILVALMQTGLSEIEAQAAASGQPLGPTEEAIIDFIRNWGMVGAIGLGLVSSLLSVVVLLIQYVFFHVSATAILGGVGSFTELVHRVTNLMTAFTVFYVLLTAAVFYVAFAMPEETAAVVVSGLSFVMFAASLGYLIWYISIIGNVYDFGFLKGCGTIIIGSILLGAVMGALSCAITPLFGGFAVTAGGGGL